ncbi:hypothetical protein OURE66S_00851 [Oligella ureolytica]
MTNDLKGKLISDKIAEQASRRFQNPYTVGCLAIEEKNLNDEQKKEIMDSFEELVFLRNCS